MLRKKMLCIVLVAVMVAGMCTGCGSDLDKGSVYFLNFKPEQ